MSKGIGRLFGVGIAKETSRGTAISSASFWIPFGEAAVEEKDQKIIDEQAFGVIEDSLGQSIAKQWSEVSIKAPIGDKHFPLLLYAALGSLSTGANADASGNVKDHTITVAQSAQHQSLTVFLKDPLASADYKHALGVVENLEIDYVIGKFLEYTATLRAKKGASASLSTAYAAENRFLPQHLTFKLASSLSGLGAASATVIRSLKLKISKNVEDDDVLGSVAPNDFLNKEFTIDGELEALWNDETFKTLALAATPQAFRLDLKNTDATIGTSANPEIRIDLAKVIFKEITRPIKINDLVKQTLSFRAHYSASDTKMITILATNLQSSY